MAIREIRGQFNSTSGPSTPDGWTNLGAGNVTGVKASDINGWGIGYEVTVAFTSASNASGSWGGPHYAIPKEVWERASNASTAFTTSSRFTGLQPNQPFEIDFFGCSTQATRHRVLRVNGVDYQHNNASDTTAPLQPVAPTTAYGVADSSGNAILFFGAVDVGALYSGVIFRFDDAWSDQPAIDDESTDLIIQNGETQTISFIRTVSDPVSLAIIYNDTVSDPIVVSQADFELVGDAEDGAVSATFTGTIGAMPYTQAGVYPASYYRYVATCADASTIELTGVNVLPQDNWQFITAADPVNTDDSFITAWLDSEDNPSTGVAANGWQLSIPQSVDDVAITLLPTFEWFSDLINGATEFPTSAEWPFRVWSAADRQWYSGVKTILDDESSVPGDTTPDSLTFNTILGALTSTVYESNSDEVADADEGVDLAITVVGGEYAVDTGAGFGDWTSEAGTVQVGDLVKQQVQSSALPNSPAVSTVTINGVASSFTVITAPEEIEIPASVLISAARRRKVSHAMTGTYRADLGGIITDLQRDIAVLQEKVAALEA